MTWWSLAWERPWVCRWLWVCPICGWTRCPHLPPPKP